MVTDEALLRYEPMLVASLRSVLAKYLDTRPDDIASTMAKLMLADPLTTSAVDPQIDERLIYRLLVDYAANRLGIPVEPPPRPGVPLPTTIAANAPKWFQLTWAALRDVDLRKVDPQGPLEPANVTTSGHVFRSLIDRQQPTGHFLQPTGNDNLESWWYAELILLHAVGTYAADTHDATAYRAAERAAVYHLNETQPDHATNEPWAIFPFLLQPATRSLADQLLHNANMMPPTGVSLLLLADALYCLRRFIHRGTA